MKNPSRNSNIQRNPFLTKAINLRDTHAAVRADVELDTRSELADIRNSTLAWLDDLLVRDEQTIAIYAEAERNGVLAALVRASSS